MFLKMILTRCYNYIIKHLEKSKCFFRTQKGVKDMEDWKARFRKEYYELKERFQKLDMMLGQYERGQLEFEPKCPIDLLKGQRSTMWNYLKILEQRAKIEEIKL